MPPPRVEHQTRTRRAGDDLSDGCAFALGDITRLSVAIRVAANDARAAGNEGIAQRLYALEDLCDSIQYRVGLFRGAHLRGEI